MIDFLNRLLATYHIVYHSLQSCHWNIKGDLFFDLHSVYGEHYDMFGEMIDEVGERIVGLKGKPVSNQCIASELSFLAHIDSVTDCCSGYENNKCLLAYFVTLSDVVSTATKQALTSMDFATAHILMEHSQKLEKLVWQYRSFGEKCEGESHIGH